MSTNNLKQVIDIRHQRKRSSLLRLVPQITNYPRLRSALMDAFENNFRYILPSYSMDYLGNPLRHIEYRIDPFQYEAIWVRLFKQQRKFIVYMLLTRQLNSPLITSYKAWLKHITMYQYGPMPESQMDLYEILKKDISYVSTDDRDVLDTYKRLISPQHYTLGSLYGTATLTFNFQTTEAEDFRLRTNLIWRDGEHHPRPKPIQYDSGNLF